MTSEQPRLIDLSQLLADAQVAALPPSAIRLLEISREPDHGPDDFAVPIESDPGLTSQVLRFVNSSYFGFSREISSVKAAITLVGVRTIKNFALWSAVFSLIPNPTCGPLSVKSLWRDSLRRGLLARAVARILGAKDPEEPFSVALLQDMAVPLLAKQIPVTYGRLLAAREDGRYPLSQLEEAVFGWTHARAAAVMARQWSLPEAFADGIEGHASMERWMRCSDAEPGGLAVALSALLPPVADSTWWECARFEDCYQRISRPGSPAIGDLLAQTDREFHDFAPVLKLTRPSRSLTDCYHEALAAAG
jgi:HD-like signal output (HDOD) protein